ncbi:MAG: Ig-like domain-containing protein [Deltaproteobacteria bacterium]|nr:Ig-like domain-containing protein [Deltaproteobacteria bacterium]
MNCILLITIFFLLFFPAPVWALDVDDTNISAHTNWTLADSPVNVNAALIVDKDITLTIDPGVTVKFSAGLTVRGRLVANGLAANPIVFTEKTPGSGWSGITFTRAGGDFVSDTVSSLQYVTMNNLKNYIWVSTRSATIDHCTLNQSGSLSYGVYAYSNNAAVYPDSSVLITNNTFNFTTTSTTTGTAAVLIDGANTVITGNDITATFNGAALIAHGIRLYMSNTAPFTAEVADNDVDVETTDDETFYLYGINLGSASITGDIIGNDIVLVSHNEVYGIFDSGGDRLIEDNSVTASSTSTTTTSPEQEMYGIYYDAIEDSSVIQDNLISLSSDKERFLKGIHCQAGTIRRNRVVGSLSGNLGTLDGIFHRYYPASILNNTVSLSAAGTQTIRGLNVSTMYTNSNIVVKNNIFRGPSNGNSTGVYKDSGCAGTVYNSYNLVYGFGTQHDGVSAGTGDVYSNPLFTNVVTLTVDSTSPSIDAGDWDDTFNSEPANNGGRINMGAFGNTASANTSAALVAPEISTNNGASFTTSTQTVTLTGRTSSSTSAIKVNDSVSGVSYTPGQTAWSVLKTLSIGSNAFSVRAFDSGNNQSGTDTIQVTYDDNTGPSVTSVDPANGETGVAVNTPITATFNEALDAATVDADCFYLNNGITGAVTYTAPTATLVPASDLAYGTTYLATLTTDIYDQYSNPMAANYTWNFTTAPDADEPADDTPEDTPDDTPDTADDTDEGTDGTTTDDDAGGEDTGDAAASQGRGGGCSLFVGKHP